MHHSSKHVFQPLISPLVSQASCRQGNCLHAYASAEITASKRRSRSPFLVQSACGTDWSSGSRHDVLLTKGSPATERASESRQPPTAAGRRQQVCFVC